jgi:hypothetical protein
MFEFSKNDAQPRRGISGRLASGGQGKIHCAIV